MVKAKLLLANGTSIEIDGKHEELQQLLHVFASAANQELEANKEQKMISKKKTRSQGPVKRSKKGPMTFVIELKKKAFFTKKKRTVNDVKTQLDTEGHFFSFSSLSVTLVRLVSKGELRRIKENNIWTYTTSDSLDE